MPVEITDVLHEQGSDNIGGLGIRIWVAPHRDVLTFPTISANPASFEDLVTISDDIVLKTDKKFIEVYGTLETNSLNNNIVGERDSKSYENMLKISHPTNKAALLGFAEYFKNTPLVVICQELGTNANKRVMGCDPNIPAYVETVEIGTGEKIADPKRGVISFKSGGKLSPIYTGAIDVTGA